MNAQIDPPEVRKLGDMIDTAFHLREQERSLASHLEDVKNHRKEVEAQIIDNLDLEGVTMGRSTSASASITETEVPVIEDIDTFYEYILAEGALHLLERRPAAGAFRENRAAGIDIPGLRPFTRRTLSLRKV